MSRFKIAMVAGVLAFIVNNVCILLLLGGGFINQWIFVRPAMDLALNIKPSWLGMMAFYMLGFLQFFIIFWVAFTITFRLKRKPPSN